MIEEIKLKEKLEIVAQNQFQPPEESELFKLIPEMLHHIGSVDSYLRDDLIYTAFATWVLEHKIIPKDQLREILNAVTSDQYMFAGMGDQNEDTVFQRAFSVLLLPLLLITHRSDPYLTQEEVVTIKNQLIAFLKGEKDRRGYVEGKGWAHAIAHAADAIDDLAQCEELTKSDLIALLDAIHAVVCVSDIGYAFGEEERIITALIAILNRGLLSDIEIEKWIERFAPAVLNSETIPKKTIARSNVKNFLQSLYFRLKWEKMLGKFGSTIDQALQDISLYSK